MRRSLGEVWGAQLLLKGNTHQVHYFRVCRLTLWRNRGAHQNLQRHRQMQQFPDSECPEPDKLHVWTTRRLQASMESNLPSKVGGKEQDPFLLPQVSLQASCWPISCFFLLSTQRAAKGECGVSVKAWSVNKTGCEGVFSGVQFHCSSGNHWVCSGLLPTWEVVWLAGAKGET